MRPCAMLRIGLAKDRSTLILAAESSNSGSPGQGRSKGYRAIVLFRRGAKAFFIYGFPKSQRANIDKDEKKQFKEAAKRVLALTEKQLAELLKRGDFVEVNAK